MRTEHCLRFMKDSGRPSKHIRELDDSAAWTSAGHRRRPILHLILDMRDHRRVIVGDCVVTSHGYALKLGARQTSDKFK